jgi:2,3-dihydroxybenzoate decarboxylase
VHALRLIGAGLFDEHPTLQIILGHLGEGIPAYLWRIDHRNEWMQARHRYAAKRWVADYFRENFVLTTSGNFSTSALNQAIAEIGVERVLWSADYPFENISDAADWFDVVPLGEAERQKIGRTNAQQLFKLKK